MNGTAASVVELEVDVTGPGDVAGAAAGGATRLHLVRHLSEMDATPELRVTEQVTAATTIPVCVPLRLRPDYSTTGGELTRMHGLIADFAAMGVAGFSLGFLNPDLQVDLGVSEDLAADVVARGLGVTFDRAVDQTLDVDRALGQVSALPGIYGIRTAGSARGVGKGLDDILRRAKDHPGLARLMVVGGGLEPEHVPWLANAGVTRVQLSEVVRPRSSWRAYVDEGLVRSWRRLLDDAVSAAA